MNNMLS